MLSAFENPGQFYRGNLHTHSNLSDGRLTPQEVCGAYEAKGYDFICLSDHFLEQFDFPIADTTPFRTRNFTTILGAEVHAGEMKLGGFWHILAVGLPLDFVPTPTDETASDLAQRCRDAGAFVAIAHPQWYGLMPEEAHTITAAHAVEIYNHTCALGTDRADGTYLLDAMLSDGRELTAIATDDAHFHADNPEHQDAFGGWVMVKATFNEPDTLVQALKEGAFYASTGPQIDLIALEGTDLLVECSPAHSIIAVGRGARAVASRGTAMTGTTLDISKFRGDWLRVIVVDHNGKRAWSNPLWID